ncbi:MAG: hypothetical protein IIB77_11040 [Proteobacteria bacterium]|nr:hypothetical protein [Pseudomonadota bacterium]
MTDLASLVSEDSRLPIERLRRCKLWVLADSLDIPYPVGAAKTDMLKILDANGIDPNLPVEIAGVQWHTMQGKDGNGNAREETYPITRPHQTSGKDIDYDGEIATRVRRNTPSEDELFETSRVEALEKEIAALKKNGAGLDFPLEDLLPWQLNHMCKDKGIDPKGMDKDQMIAALGVGNGQDITQRSQ